MQPKTQTKKYLAAVREYCRENLTAYKVPKHFEFRDELPKTNVGKVLRRELRDSEESAGNTPLRER